MAWPYDARYQTFSANQQVTSAFLNDVQDKIYPLYAETQSREYWYIACAPHLNGGGLSWEFSQHSTGYGLLKLVAGEPCFIPIQNLDNNQTIDEVKVKYYNNQGSSYNITIAVHEIVLNSGSTTPSSAATYPGSPSGVSVGAGAWGLVSTGSGLNCIISSQSTYYVYVQSSDGAGTGDIIAGVGLILSDVL